jgi:hypothetical protein
VQNKIGQVVELSLQPYAMAAGIFIILSSFRRKTEIRLVDQT